MKVKINYTANLGETPQEAELVFRAKFKRFLEFFYYTDENPSPFDVPDLSDKGNLIVNIEYLKLLREKLLDFEQLTGETIQMLQAYRAVKEQSETAAELMFGEQSHAEEESDQEKNEEEAAEEEEPQGEQDREGDPDWDPCMLPGVRR